MLAFKRSPFLHLPRLARRQKHLELKGAGSLLPEELHQKKGRNIAKGEFDPAKRRALVAEALKLGATNVHYIPLYQQTLLWGMKQSVTMVQLPDGVVQVKWVKVSE